MADAAGHLDVGGAVGRELTRPCCPADKDKVLLHCEWDSEKQKGVTSVITAAPSEGKHRVPTDVVCVIDTSGSMGMEATMKDGTDKIEAVRLSILDLVKHSVLTISKSLCEQDTLTVISYSDDAKVLVAKQKMDEGGQTLAAERIATLMPDARTNIWAGLKLALETLGKDDEPGRHGQIMLLTDGQPNISPEGGEQKALKQFRDEGFKASVHTFGFGYNLNGPLLTGIAEVGGGAFSFIPDASLMGTVFVNALANMLCTMSTRSSVMFSDGAQSIEVDVGPLLLGQQRSVLVPEALSQNPVKLTAQLVYHDVKTAMAQSKVMSFHPSYFSDRVPLSAYGELQVLRITAVETLAKIIEANNRQDGTKAKELRDAFVAQCEAQTALLSNEEELNASGVTYKKAAEGLIEDFTGQIEQACRQDYYTKWGKYYLPSLRMAHQMQQCNNFKDPGVQTYGGELFHECQDDMDNIFCSMPPPKGTLPARSTSTNLSSSTSAAPAAAPDMRAYMNCGGGCFDGTCIATTPEGPLAVRALRKGAQVRTGINGSDWAKVRCVVRTSYPRHGTAMVQIPNGPTVTPYHPVYIGETDRAWQAPVDIAPIAPEGCSEVFNLVLDGGAAVELDGVPCVTLGHGLTDKGAKHDYFGTGKVIADLSVLPGWDAGEVVLSHNAFLRDPQTGLVCGISGADHRDTIRG